ncbi:hypothetical protein ACLOJK_037167, partial [Asimina triloba]
VERDEVVGRVTVIEEKVLLSLTELVTFSDDGGRVSTLGESRYPELKGIAFKWYRPKGVMLYPWDRFLPAPMLRSSLSISKVTSIGDVRSSSFLTILKVGM